MDKKRFEDPSQEIVEFMKEGAYRPMSFKELVGVFGVKRDGRERFKRLIKRLVGDGTLIEIRGGRYGLPSKMNLVTGELICHPDGFGFVRPDEGGPDVFIAPRRLSGAMHGDTVAARVEGVKEGGKREGRIIRVIKRAHRVITGRIEKDRGFYSVIPSDERILDKIVVPPRDARGAGDGVIVSVEITRWPSRETVAAGRVLEVLGDPEDPDVEAEVILKKYGLPSRFPADVMEEVKGVPSRVLDEDIKGRVDLRNRTVITIDGETARDFDDAVSIERAAEGYRLWVSIADVSRYVPEGGALDAEAYARSTSVYFPDRCVPMLPEALSNGICSLNPHEDRLTLTAEMEFDSSGRTIGKRFYESVIKSAERMTYTDVKKLLESVDPDLERRYARILPDLKAMDELARKLTRRRMEAGGIDFDLPEPQIILDIEGNIEDIVRSERNSAHRLIEEFMLSANRAAAEEFSSRDLPFLYRVHGEPDSESIDDFVEFIAGFGLRFNRTLGPRAFGEALKAAEGRPEEKLVNHVLLRSMKQAVYSEENIGHFGLAFEDYTHFTSPIRRYPDLVVHRLLKLLIHRRYSAEERSRMEAMLPEIAGHTSGRERKAMEAEREIVDLKKAQFMKDKVGEQYDGFISGVTSFGLFVELKEYFVEGLVHVSTLLDDYYIFDDRRHSLVGENTKRKFSLGDAVSVRIEGVDVARRRIEMALAEEPGPKAGRKGNGKDRGRGKGKGRARARGR